MAVTWTNRNPDESTNNVQNIVKVSGRTHYETIKFPASVAIEEGSLVVPNGATGLFKKFAAGDALFGGGVIRQSILTSDADFAEEKTITIEVPTDEQVVYRITASAGTFAPTSKYQLLDLADEKSANAAGTSNGDLYVYEVISAEIANVKIQFDKESA